MSPAGNSQAGFTLTELLVVLAILTLIVSITPPLYRTVVPGARLKGAQVELLAYLRDARSEAERRGSIVELTISDHGVSRSLENKSRFYVPSGAKLSYLPAFDDAKADPPLIFFPDGGSSGGRIVLEDGNMARTLDVHWLTSHIVMGP